MMHFVGIEQICEKKRNRLNKAIHFQSAILYFVRIKIRMMRLIVQVKKLK